jgi:hypothetical protein
VRVSGRVSWNFQASARRLDRTYHLLRSAAQLVPFRVQLKRNFEQCSPPALRAASVVECEVLEPSCKASGNSSSPFM